MTSREARIEALNIVIDGISDVEDILMDYPPDDHEALAEALLGVVEMLRQELQLLDRQTELL